MSTWDPTFSEPDPRRQPQPSPSPDDPARPAEFAPTDAGVADAGAAETTAADGGAAEVGEQSVAELDEAVEADLDELAVVSRERDDYLDALRRLQADFENYKKRMLRQQTEQLERAAEGLIGKLLPVFDTADLAVAHGGGEEVKQIWTALFDTLEREGLERIDAAHAPFDPTVHDAVVHEPAGEEPEPVVAEVMRAGYRWKGRVLRPAMVKVRG